MKKADAHILREIALIVASAETDCVLVGGLATEIYRALFVIDSDIANLTTDIDFFGGLVDIQAAESALKNAGERTRIFLATMDDQVPNSGKLVVYRDGIDPIEIDFLYQVHNVSDDDIEERAIKIDIGGRSIRVVHPLVLMEMKLGNLAFFPEKRDREGIDQARIALHSAREYLERYSASASFSQRTLLDHVKRVIRFSSRNAACYAMEFFKLDPLSVISDNVAKACGRKFQEIRMPQAIALTEKNRKSFSDMLLRIRETGKDPKRMRFC